MREVWKKIAGFPEYKVSSLGRVKRWKPDSYGRFLAEMLAQVAGSHGYLTVSLHRKGRQSTRTVHRIVCETFRGKPPSPKHHASHYDGNKRNNRKSNVRWLLPSDNNYEKNRHGTMRTGDNHHARYMPECMPRGSSHGNSKLTERQVEAIRSDLRSQRIIGLDYSITQSLLSMIKRRVIWRHI